MAADQRRELGHHAAINARNKTGQTALHKSVFEFFNESRPILPNEKVAAFLLDHGAEVNAHDDAGTTPLLEILGVWRGSLDIVRLLLAKGADPNAANNNGRTPLMVVAASAKRDAAELLIAKHADLNAKDKSGASALCLAIEAAQKEMVDWLLTKGASLDTTPYATRAAVADALRDFHSSARRANARPTR